MSTPPSPGHPRVLVITNAAHEPPGLIADWLSEAGAELTGIRPWAGEALPGLDALGTSVHGLVVMGGPQSAYPDPATGELAAPWLTDTKVLLAGAVDRGVPVLAVCLGAQLLAEACGGLVRPGDDGPELGARLVAKRDAATSDPLVGRLPMMPDVIQWHWDAIAVLPPGATLLASSSTYPNQAFRMGPADSAAYGLQFHIEVGVDTVREWAMHDADGLDGDVDAMLAGVARVQDDVFTTWRPFVAAWAARVVTRAREAGAGERTSRV